MSGSVDILCQKIITIKNINERDLIHITQYLICTIYISSLQISQEQQVEQQQNDDLVYEDQSGYVLPEKRSLQQILDADKNDDSLTRYKNSLIDQKNIKHNDKHVIFTQLIIQQEGKDQIFDFDKINDNSILFQVKQGVPFIFVFKFNVYNDIVMGLRTVMRVNKSLITVTKGQQMFGCFAPGENQQAKTGELVISKSIILRGKYSAKFAFGDDDEGDGAFGTLQFQFQVV